MENVKSLMEENSELFRQAYNEKIQIWIDHVFLSWRWWIGVAVVVVCLLIWFWIRKHENADRLFYAGFFTAILTTFLNLTGMTFGLWEYSYELIPAEAYIPWDFFLLPTVIMLLLLFKPNLNLWYKAIFLGAFTSFVGLPVITWLGLYKPMNWNYIYSFPIMVVIYLLAHFISCRKKIARFN
jgi:hypothetical protein